MSNVNADATQLLTILKNMRTSISSIETTRSSVKMKYQQLGIGWNDKKYDELGTIVISQIGKQCKPVQVHSFSRFSLRCNLRKFACWGSIPNPL